MELSPTCPKCEKPPELCVCSIIEPLKNKFHVVILQHPQEPDKLLGSAKLASLALKNSTLKIGLSWPSLSKILDRQVTQANWGVLYLGGRSGNSSGPQSQDRIQITKKGGKVFTVKEAALEGIVVLDGSWSQAKALWWRNAWLLKLKRISLNPSQPSLYRELRREPRRECLSTIESVAETLGALGENKQTTDQLRTIFGALLDKYRATKAKPKN